MSPILKEGDFEEPGNNRPITLLPIFPTVCEKAVLNQLTPYLKTNKWLAVEQNRKKSGTPLKLLLLSLLMDTMLEVVDKRKLTAIIFICGHEQSVE